MEKLRLVLQRNSFYVFLLIITIIYSIYYINEPKASDYTETSTHLKGKLISYKVDGDKLKMVLKGENENVNVNYVFTSLEEKNAFEKEYPLGTEVEASGEFSSPLNNTIPNVFNYKKYLYYHHTFYIVTASSIEKTSEEISILYKVKNAVIDRIKSIPEVNDYLLTFIIGDKSLLDEETFNNYRINGVTHLFAISGMHIGLFSAFLLGLLKKLGVREKGRYFFTILFIIFYAFLTGFPPSVKRAGLLFSLLAINRLAKLNIKTIKVLILTGIILVLLDPFLLLDIGFEYSFLTTFGLIHASSLLKEHKIIGTSLIAMMWSLPITINNFYEFNVLSVLINVIFVPFVSSIVYPLCLFNFVFTFITPITKFTIDILEWLNTVCSSITTFQVITPKMSIVLVVVFYLILLLVPKIKLTKSIFLLTCIVLLNQGISKMDANYYVEVLDVGQGDSILIRSPHNKEVVLIDTGGSMTFEREEWQKRKKYNVSSNTITYLHSLGISKIDTIIFTHGDEDHMGEAQYILDNIEVKNAIMNLGNYNSNEKEVLNSGINILKDYKGSLDFKILWTDVSSDENANSIISLLNVKGTIFLFMGDAPKSKEEEVLNKYELSDIDIVKLGHHGSKTSSGEVFLKEINAKVGLISSGRNNRFHHPHAETIDTLNSLNMDYYNTQDKGTITYAINKSGKISLKFCYP